MKHAPRVSLVIAICLHSVSDIAEQAPLALSNVKTSCKHGPWLVARANKRGQENFPCPLSVLCSRKLRLNGKNFLCLVLNGLVDLLDGLVGKLLDFLGELF